MSPADLFDPQTLRGLSIVQDDDAHCVRHDREMEKDLPMIHHMGGIYTTSDGYTAYTCGACLADIIRYNGGGDPRAVRQELMRAAFDKWDKGKLPSDTFQFVGEGTVEDGIVIPESDWWDEDDTFDEEA